jgi:hypothetical protein
MALPKLKIIKATSLPATKTPNTIYYVPHATDNNLMEVYFSSSDGSSVKKIPNTTEIQSMIDASLASYNETLVTPTITTRDALTLTRNTPVYVLDATGDTTVGSGAALYLWDNTTEEFYKLAEFENMDIVLQWADIQGKPTSAVADIVDAVTKRHVNDNKLVIDKFTEDTEGDVLYNGELIPNRLDATAAW